MSVTPSSTRSQTDHGFFFNTRAEGIPSKHAAEGVSLELKNSEKKWMYFYDIICLYIKFR